MCKINSNYYTDGTTIDEAGIEYPNLFSDSFMNRPKKKLAQTMAQAYAMEKGRAYLAHQSMRDLSILSHEADVLANLAPSGANYYRAITEVVAYKSCEALALLFTEDKEC